MDADTAPGLADLINRQLGQTPGTPLPKGITVWPAMLWALLALEVTSRAPPWVEETHFAAE